MLIKVFRQWINPNKINHIAEQSKEYVINGEVISLNEVILFMDDHSLIIEDMSADTLANEINRLIREARDAD